MIQGHRRHTLIMLINEVVFTGATLKEFVISLCEGGCGWEGVDEGQGKVEYIRTDG